MSVDTRHRRKTQSQRAAIMRERNNQPACPAVKSITKVGNQLRLVVIRYLLERPMRFNELLEAATGVDPRSLSRVLKFLGSEDIVWRDVLSTQPFAVQYSLTEKGRQLQPVVEALRAWGERWLMPQEVVVNNTSTPLHQT